jgi:hypothetical protein
MAVLNGGTNAMGWTKAGLFVLPAIAFARYNLRHSIPFLALA